MKLGFFFSPLRGPKHETNFHHIGKIIIQTFNTKLIHENKTSICYVLKKYNERKDNFFCFYLFLKIKSRILLNQQ